MQPLRAPRWAQFDWSTVAAKMPLQVRLTSFMLGHLSQVGTSKHFAPFCKAASLNLNNIIL
jgi:hypothetical protein